MNNLEWKTHSATWTPVGPKDVVVYRTQIPDEQKSHIHMPMIASGLDWSKRPSLGRICEYAVVKRS